MDNDPSVQSGGAMGAACLAQLRVLAQLQSRLHPRPLPAVAAWLAARAGPVLATWRNRERRAAVEERLQALTQAGYLAPMLQVLEDPAGTQCRYAGGARGGAATGARSTRNWRRSPAARRGGRRRRRALARRSPPASGWPRWPRCSPWRRWAEAPMAKRKAATGPYAAAAAAFADLAARPVVRRNGDAGHADGAAARRPARARAAGGPAGSRTGAAARAQHRAMQHGGRGRSVARRCGRQATAWRSRRRC